ncbi:hypothetical protein, partial [Prevotella sp.]|uniref:hypothetical protein n=1 Tax=Prevotella sp. TaxID=59823 RepID=UPI003FD8BBD1
CPLKEIRGFAKYIRKDRKNYFMQTEMEEMLPPKLTKNPKKILSSLGHYVGLMMCCWNATYGW